MKKVVHSLLAVCGIIAGIIGLVLSIRELTGSLTVAVWVIVGGVVILVGLPIFVWYCRTRKLKHRHALLKAFRYICSENDREDIDLTIHDLNVDTKTMREKGRNEFSIRAIVTWRSLLTLFTIIWSKIIGPFITMWRSR